MASTSAGAGGAAGAGPAQERPRILLMGARRGGKSSIQRVVFHKMSPHETLFLESTNLLDIKFIANNAPVTDPDPSKRRAQEVWEAYLDTENLPGGTVVQLMQVTDIEEGSDVTFVANPSS